MQGLSTRTYMLAVKKGKKDYILLDEIQMVPDWQKTANSLRDKENVDLYLTGSNAYMFSSKLGTILGGRYTEIKMQPLSFKEYVDGIHGLKEFKLPDGSSGHIMTTQNIMVDYKNYIIQSGFPQTLKYNGDMELITDYLEVMTELGGIKLFIFVGLRGYLDDDELKRFVKNLKDRQIDVLLIENISREAVDEIPRVIIDRDLCEI